MENKILIGTSGYSFPDWTGNFYPPDIKKEDFFRYYTTQFKAVEINYTYYTFPYRRTFEVLEKYSPEGFLFYVKAHSSMTHSRDADDFEFEKFYEALKPISETGKLAGILFQFPESFHWTPANIGYLKRLFDKRKTDFAVEFRHRSWIRPEVRDLFKEYKATAVSVDEPDDKHLLGKIFLLANDILYIRFHSRNTPNWYRGTDMRYDYLYTEAELNEWIQLIQNAVNNIKKAFIFFNNCHEAKAVKNAKMLMELMMLE